MSKARWTIYTAGDGGRGTKRNAFELTIEVA